MNLCHDTQPVASPHPLYVAFVVLAAQKMEREVDHLAGIGHASYGSVTIKVGADSHMLDSHDVDGMLKMGYGIEYGGLASLGEEPFVKRYVGNTTASWPALAFVRQ